MPNDAKPWLFKPGQSGNPHGRPPKSKAMTEIERLARDHCPAAIEALAEIVKDKKSGASARCQAAQILLDRGFGRPKMATDVTLRVSSGDPRALSEAELMAVIEGEARQVEDGTEH